MSGVVGSFASVMGIIPSFSYSLIIARLRDSSIISNPPKPCQRIWFSVFAELGGGFPPHPSRLTLLLLPGDPLHPSRLSRHRCFYASQQLLGVLVGLPEVHLDLDSVDDRSRDPVCPRCPEFEVRDDHSQLRFRVR